MLSTTPSLLGLRRIDQLAPFQVSTRVWTGDEALLYVPAAMQKADETQATPASSFALNLTLGEAEIVQLVAFEDSISVPPSSSPTAVQELVDMHATLEN
jgi:hypothetical protein